MSDFIFIIPEGWIKLDWLDLSNNGILRASEVNIAGLGYPMSDVESALKLYGTLQADDILQEIKVFNDEVCIIKLG